MPATTAETVRSATSPLVIALAGALSLSVAMGIGRFAFTPLLPMMLNDGVITINGGSVLATANYIGYLVGAIFCMVLPAILVRIGLRMPSNAAMVRFGLLATALLTAAMALDMPWLWSALRLSSGIISAVVFVYTSGWCLKRLAETNALSLSGIIYTGPGIGITISGFASFGMSAADGSSGQAWIAFGILAGLLSAVIWPIFRADRTTKAQTQNHGQSDAAKPERWTAEHLILAFAYGLAGFGYIITATFLPVIAKETLGNSVWIDLFWPVFGIGVAAGAVMTRVIPLAIDRRLLLVLCYLIQAVGVVAALILPSVLGFLIGSTLVGLPFTVITLFGMQEARRLRPHDATSFMALMTAAYGIGQIAGPPLAAAILAGSASHAAGFSLSLITASSTLALGAVLYALLFWRYPVGR
jgi:MFS family permease